MDGVSRRTLMATGAAGALALAAGSAGRAAGLQPAERIRLLPLLPERDLPDRMLGMNTPGVYDIPYEDPKVVAALKALAPNVIRFPGGTVGNYYQWRLGHMVVPDGPGASTYRRLLVDAAVPASRRLHPKGVHIEHWVDIARELDAALVLNPNIETSTVADQRAWFADMHAKGIVPNLIEMGAEFYLAMFMDPLAMAVTPNWEVTIRRTREYYDAFKPYLARDAKVAVQSASSRFGDLDPYASKEELTRHEAEWDRDMQPEPWFDAVTTHLYPQLEGSAGSGALKRLPDDAEEIFKAMLARADQGFERSLNDTAARMPGKEIWMTEWGSFEAAQTLGGQPNYFSGLWLHQVTRGQMSILRQKEVTLSNYHAAFFSGNLMSSFVRADGGYEPINASAVLNWFFEASRGPNAHYRRLTVDGAGRITANGTIPGEQFWEVEAGVLRQGRRHTLIVHNAGKTTKAVDLRALTGGAPVTAQTIATPDLMVNLEKATPTPIAVPATSGSIDVPGYSVSRIAWNA